MRGQFNSPMSRSRRLTLNNSPSIAILRCHCRCAQAMLVSLLSLGLAQGITQSDLRLHQQLAWAHDLSDCKSGLVMVEQQTRWHATKTNLIMLCAA